MLRLSLAACLLTLGPAPPAPAQEAGAAAVLHFADGSSLPLRPWSLSYEYMSWKQGGSPALASANRTAMPAIWSGKKAYPVAGATLEIEYDLLEREREDQGEIRKEKVARARLMRLTGSDGKRQEIKLEQPHRELLAPGADKSMVVQPRSLDLMGQSLTGTRREFCLASYSSLVECHQPAGQQIVKIEFPR